MVLRLLAVSTTSVVIWWGSMTATSAAIDGLHRYHDWWTVTQRWNDQCAGAPFYADEPPFSHPVPGACDPVRPWEIWRNVNKL